MSTKNIVPRLNGEGNLGTSEKKWYSINTNTVNTNVINANTVNGTLSNETVMKGATSTTNGILGSVPAPTKYDVEKYLRGDGTWQIPIDAYTKTETDNVIATKIAEIVANADEDFDTLKEIADWIKNDKSEAAKLQNDVNNKLDSSKIIFATTDLTPNISELETNSIYFVYEM